MLARLGAVPLFVALLGVTGLAMLIPSAYGFLNGHSESGRAFLYSGLIGMLLALFLALATARPTRQEPVRSLFALLALIYLALPAFMALPLTEAVPGLRPFDAWFEMVAAFTTTGATLFDAPREVAPAVHLWRGMAGWAGGGFILAAVVALLNPIGLGGIEVQGNLARAPILLKGTFDRAASGRLYRALADILPWYLGGTVVLAVILVATGQSGLDAIMLAMAVLSTSGVIARDGMGQIGFVAELALFVALIVPLSRAFVPRRMTDLRRFAPLADPELRLAAVLVAALVLAVVVRHWFAAAALAEGENLPALGRAIWGAAFTGLSFVTTTGLVNEDWVTIRGWSGLSTPGLVLMGLALVGGGIATTAGGVKLMRVLVLLRLGRAETERLIYPSIVAAQPGLVRGARAAWLFVMVFAMAAGVLVAVLTVLGMGFETAMIFTTAALTTTGPLIGIAGDLPLFWGLLSDPAKAVLALAMILGRLEILALLALLAAQIGRD